MKTILLSVILLMILPLANAQQETPFPTENAKWYQVKWEPTLQPPPLYYYHTRTFETLGDTIIGGKTYTTLSQGWYNGAYRVEKDSNHVYYYDYYENEEFLVYDYNLVPGDTMYINNLIYVCTDTGSYLLNDGNYHKYQIMFIEHGGFDCEQIWVHGIGSLRDPILEPLGGCIYLMYQQARDITCFFINDTLVYEWSNNPFFEGCEGSNTIGIDNWQNENPFSIVPNPVTDISRITSKNNSEIIVEYKIFDVTGRLLKSENNSAIYDIEICNYSFAKGMYYLQLNFSGRVQVLKFIIH